MGVEPMHSGFADRRVNHFATWPGKRDLSKTGLFGLDGVENLNSDIDRLRICEEFWEDDVRNL